MYFSEGTNGSTALPEIFVLDVPTLQSIRNTTQTAASGCALGWHASQAAKCNPEVLLQEKGAPLVQAMQNRRHNSIEDYEQSVEDAVVSLAQSWKGSRLDEELETLRGKTRAVLRGKDAVMQLMDLGWKRPRNQQGTMPCKSLRTKPDRFTSQVLIV